jgi:UDP-glucuronate 4-epimerase
MRALVTGGAGFIGSHLSERLLSDGHEVIALDSFTPYYEPTVKRANVAHLLDADGYTLLDADLLEADLSAIIDGVTTVFHLAGQPGVRHSWSDGFVDYDRANILSTQRLLEACRTAPAPPRVVYSSSSSVYGEHPPYPTSEAALPSPHSPYGVTKLAAEHLCTLYAGNWGLPTVSLRYFTVYGPRQRPDMAIHRFIEAAMEGTEIELYGDGEQRRDFTYVADVVAANVLAASAPVALGTVVNIGGRNDVSVNQLLDLVAEATGTELRVRRGAPQPGDVRRTSADVARAEALLGWAPHVALDEGVRAQVSWHRARRSPG